MALESPLFLTRLECPICGTVNEIETIRVGAYTEGERMTDFCPSTIKWRNPKYQKYNPLLFFAATCSHCFYSREFNAKYREWAKDNNFTTYRLKNLKEKHLSNMALENSFVKLVGDHLDMDNYPDETAIMKLLLAVFDEQLNAYPSALDLGRLYLRIAWMFRHRNSDDETETETVDSGHISDIERGIGDIRSWMAGFGRNIEYLNNAVTAHFEKQPDDSMRERFVSVAEELKNRKEDGQKFIEELETLLGETRLATGGGAGGFNSDFFEFDSFDEFLNRLIRIWDGVPRNEFEAMRLAVKFYISAFESEREISHGNQSIQAGYLIGELSRQVSDHDTARQYFNTTIKMGQDFIKEIKGDRTRTALARKILEMAMTQGKKNLAEAK